MTKTSSHRTQPLKIIIAFIVFLLMACMGYIRDEYQILWHYPFQIEVTDRYLTSSTASIQYSSQIPSLLTYLLLFYLGNSLVINILSHDKSWWNRMFYMYVAACILAGVLVTINQLVIFSVLLTAAQMLKEFLLSPLPSLVIIPLLWWQNQSLNRLR